MEFGILMDDGHVIVGPGWGSVAEVMDSYHGFGVSRVYGQLVTRASDDGEWTVHAHE